MLRLADHIVKIMLADERKNRKEKRRMNHAQNSIAVY